MRIGLYANLSRLVRQIFLEADIGLLPWIISGILIGMDETTEQSIQRVMTEIGEAKREVKVVRDNVNDVLEQNDEYKTLKEELKVLTEKRALMKKVMADDKDYQKLATDLEELRFKLKDLQEILSHHLVAYYNETQNTEIKDADGEVHTLVLSAKIGRLS